MIGDPCGVGVMRDSYSDGGAAWAVGATLFGVTVREKTLPSPAEIGEAVRVRRLREDARRPMNVNLAEGIALSHMLMRFAGAARKA